MMVGLAVTYRQNANGIDIRLEVAGAALHGGETPLKGFNDSKAGRAYTHSKAPPESRLGIGLVLWSVVGRDRRIMARKSMKDGDSKFVTYFVIFWVTGVVLTIGVGLLSGDPPTCTKIGPYVEPVVIPCPASN